MHVHEAGTLGLRGRALTRTPFLRNGGAILRKGCILPLHGAKLKGPQDLLTGIPGTNHAAFPLLFLRAVSGTLYRKNIFTEIIRSLGQCTHKKNKKI